MDRRQKYNIGFSTLLLLTLACILPFTQPSQAEIKATVIAQLTIEAPTYTSTPFHTLTPTKTLTDLPSLTPTPELTNTPKPTRTPTPEMEEQIYSILQEARLPSWVGGIGELQKIPSYFPQESGYDVGTFVTFNWAEGQQALMPYYSTWPSIRFLQNGEVAGAIAIFVYEKSTDAWKCWDTIADDMASHALFYVPSDDGNMAGSFTFWDEKGDIYYTQMVQNVPSTPRIIWTAIMVGPKDQAMHSITEIINSTMDDIIAVVERYR